MLFTTTWTCFCFAAILTKRVGQNFFLVRQRLLEGWILTRERTALDDKGLTPIVIDLRCLHLYGRKTSAQLPVPCGIW
jgi:hypothetical protein